ncbi:hypothetical protein HN018_19275 [Lichenicola cladoniae]|uniref:Uncharacterized protein n=1 Tax=Lichenicola cladoniae TaxID=1484109 RepID=A0A6M8HUQ7_9PROT|nr:hypothetical protein [Lichenicola cladoniae]NPD68288.1 hypothetical protein [Acetobacteraceae bacterium]QKE91887.1 hypothetical protein HN018_19275 [Lichenicola cladoniae]
MQASSLADDMLLVSAIIIQGIRMFLLLPCRAQLNHQQAGLLRSKQKLLKLSTCVEAFLGYAYFTTSLGNLIAHPGGGSPMLSTKLPAGFTKCLRHCNLCF